MMGTVGCLSCVEFYEARVVKREVEEVEAEVEGMKEMERLGWVTRNLVERGLRRRRGLCGIA